MSNNVLKNFPFFRKLMNFIENVPCPFCGNLCEDIFVGIENNKITLVENACEIGAEKFLRVDKRHKKPLYREKNKINKSLNDKFISISWEEAFNKVTKILKNANKPVLYGFSSTSIQTTRVAIDICKTIGGIIDNTTSICHNPSVVAIQRTGLPTATLGEVFNHADLIIYWGCNPLDAHLRHLSKYTVFPRGLYRERGYRDRIIFTIDVRETSTAKRSTFFIKLLPGQDLELISVLRLCLKGYNPKDVSGVKKQEIAKLVEKLKKSKYIAIFYGLGLTGSEGGYLTIENLIGLTIDLNKKSKAVLRPMRGHFNVTGACEVFTWKTGYPFAVDFTSGKPFYNPGDTTIMDILERKDLDALLVVGADPLPNLPISTSKILTEIPVIVIDPMWSISSEICDIYLPCAITGIEAGGTAYRMDGVPIKLKKLIYSNYYSDFEILENIFERLKCES
jgi:formylmethanofuran dehydrogenase subunit B